MNFTNLKYFCDAVQLGGISRAAKANFVTQSAISQGISKLERSLDMELVVSHPNRFKLTPSGEAVFHQAIDVLKKIADFQEQLLSKETEYLGDLEFASTYSFAATVIPKMLDKFRKKHPQVKINFRLGCNDDVKQMVKIGVVDFGILPNEADLEDFAAYDLYSGSLKLYCSRKIKQKNLGFILAQPESNETIYLRQEYRKKFGKDLTSLLEVGSWEIIAQLVASGMGIGFLPDYIGERKELHLQEYDLGIRPQHYCMSSIFPKGMQLRKSSSLFLSLFSVKPSNKFIS